MDKTREERRNETCEVFTPQETVRTMLEKLPHDMFESEKTFLDNSCGNGNMLVEVLLMKLEHTPEDQTCHQLPLDKGNTLGYNILPEYLMKCISSLYGTDMMEDNIEECKKRLLDIFWAHVYKGGIVTLAYLDDASKILDKHIVCTKMEDWDYEGWCPIYEKLF